MQLDFILHYYTLYHLSENKPKKGVKFIKIRNRSLEGEW